MPGTSVKGEKNMELSYNIIYKNLDEIDNSVKSFKDIKSIRVNECNELKFYFDFNSMKETDYKQIIKKFYKLKNKIMRHHRNSVNNIEIYMCGFDFANRRHIDFSNAVTAIMKPTKYDMYSYIYDEVCDYLDNYFINENLCDFEDNRCIAKRNTSCTVGCCRHFKNKKLGPLLPKNKLIVCEYLKDKRCSAKCISCKLFTCGYLEKHGISFKIRKIFLLDTFFNPIQKYFIKCQVFTPKEKIMKKLIMWS